jgi:LysR family transcriptional activator of nhaA
VLGETEILLYAHGELVRVARRRFPRSLSRIPLVLPPAGSPLRVRLDGWFASQRIEVNVKAEIEDAGQLRTFGSAKRGGFPVRAALKAEVEDLHDVQLVGACDGIRKRYKSLPWIAESSTLW